MKSRQVIPETKYKKAKLYLNAIGFGLIVGISGIVAHKIWETRKDVEYIIRDIHSLP